MISLARFHATLLYPLFALVFATNTYAEKAERPNFIVIVADDMGWSDIGAFGSEIRTPTLDSLAEQGVTMTNFYVAPTCSPTRSMLMTGVDSHLAGLGTMEGVQAENQTHSDAYSGQLRDDVVTVAEALKASGYATLMSGKWHLAKDASQYPSNRGFDRSFTLIEGGASHFSDAAPLYRTEKATYLEDGVVTVLPDDFYSSKAYTDKMLGYLNSLNSETPFFAYVAYTAPHDPLQVPDPWLDKYSGVYEQGPESLRAQRAQALLDRGLIPEGTELWVPPTFPKFLPAYVKPWSMMDDVARKSASRPMEIYAAMVEYMDDQIHRLIDELERTGHLENTYIIFLSDNGANGATPLSYPGNTREWFLNEYKQGVEDQGRRGSHTYMGRDWASVSASPFKLYKGAIAEGGIRAPLIVTGPLVEKNKISKQVSHITDLTATLYALAGINTSSNILFKDKIRPEGQSLFENWKDISNEKSRTFATELFGHRSVVSDRWKATNMRPPLGSGKWELYDLSEDPSEVNNLAEVYPDKLTELVAYYDNYKKRVGVILPDPPISVSLGDLFTTECNWYCQIIVSVVDFTIDLWVSLFVSDE
ncbi:arylsulfatase [Zhongshania sp. BJYM1]|uniref:arylsulfatase n=1 Tax=Zhongshania aquatica TaxID=2965069 RepID=UPI0022B2F280|nr:arylsulfatase [Marortus sp. BJYM1]